MNWMENATPTVSGEVQRVLKEKYGTIETSTNAGVPHSGVIDTIALTRLKVHRLRVKMNFMH